MTQRTQITLDREQHRAARAKAEALGISLAEYVRRLVARDLARPTTTADPSGIYDLGHGGETDVATDKDDMVGAAFSGRRDDS